MYNARLQYIKREKDLLYVQCYTTVMKKRNDAVFKFYTSETSD